MLQQQWTTWLKPQRKQFVCLHPPIQAARSLVHLHWRSQREAWMTNIQQQNRTRDWRPSTERRHAQNKRVRLTVIAPFAPTAQQPTINFCSTTVPGTCATPQPVHRTALTTSAVLLSITFSVLPKPSSLTQPHLLLPTFSHNRSQSGTSRGRTTTSLPRSSLKHALAACKHECFP